MLKQKQKTSFDKIQDKKKKKVEKQPSFYQAVGRRKEATARVRLYVGDDEVILKDKVLKKGEMFINCRPIEEYFSGGVARKIYLEPFRTTNTLSRFVVSSKISGGGLSGQLGAFIHGVARALEKVDREKFRPTLKKKGFLTRDARVKERRKAGYAQKARARKQSPKR